MGYEQYITVTPDVRGGKPCIQGTRITVYDILEYLAGGMTEAQILADFPTLRSEHIKAVLAFAADRERRAGNLSRRMKFLFDENLSRALARVLADIFPGSVHITAVAATGMTDTWLWEFAASNSFTIVSKDNDFRQRSFLRGSASSKVVWLSVGNAGTTVIARLLRERHADLIRFAGDPAVSLLVVSL